MGLSFTFLAACMTAASQDYGVMVGAIIVGGVFEGILGLTAKYWRKIISPILSACVVVSIGLSILNVGVSSFGSSCPIPGLLAEPAGGGHHPGGGADFPYHPSRAWPSSCMSCWA